MEPAVTAILDAHLWTQGPRTRGSILVQHPNGVELSITRTKTDWNLRHYQHPANAYWDGYHHLARISRESTDTGFAAVQADTIRAVGTDARARLQSVLDAIALWAHGLPNRDPRILLWRQSGYVQLAKHQDEVALPEDLRTRLQDIAHVQRVEPGGGGLSNSDHGFEIILPVTAHGLLQLRARGHHRTHGLT